MIEKLSTSERVMLMKKHLGDVSDVSFGELSGASKSVVGQWLSGEIKNISPRYAYTLEENTSFKAKWIMLCEGPQTSDMQKEVIPAAAIPYRKSVQAVIDLMLHLDEETQGYIRGIVAATIKEELAQTSNKDNQKKIAGRPGTR
jgi:hypothetical protein